MPAISYICKDCSFAFERVGSVDACPGCGSTNVLRAQEDQQRSEAAPPAGLPGEESVNNQDGWDLQSKQE